MPGAGKGEETVAGGSPEAGREEDGASGEPPVTVCSRDTAAKS